MVHREVGDPRPTADRIRAAELDVYRLSKRWLAKLVDEGHVSGAVNIPYDTIDRVIHQTEPDARRDIVLYCRSGRRSALAAQALARVGYTNVVDAGSLENARAALEP